MARRMGTAFRLKIALILGLIFLAIAILLYLRYQEDLIRPIPLSEPKLFEIERGEGFGNVLDRLEAEGLLKSGWALRLHALLSGKARAIKAGEYLLKPGLTPKELLDLFVAGRIHHHRFVISEGWTVRDLLKALRNHSKLKQTLKDIPPDKLLETLGLPPGHPEGRFFPDTYFYTKGMNDRELLLRAYRRMEKILAELWQGRDPNVPLKTPYEALILASIVQKENSSPSEQPLIAGVFYNRLRLGMPLQADPTVIYGLGDSFDGDLKRSHLYKDTPYNTYTRKGLPPTPIALPGKSALLAVLHPTKTEALYFVANGRGRHVFSKTYKEHLQAVRRYQLRR